MFRKRRFNQNFPRNTEKRRLKGEQKAIIEQKLTKKTKGFGIKLQKLENEKNKIRERFDKKISLATKTAEAKVRREVSLQLKSKMHESVKKEVEKATANTQKNLFRATQTIEATRKQMLTLRAQNVKQQDRIRNLETQLQNQTTPQLEGLLYEDKLMEALKKDFPQDKFTHTGKGGDILHEIMLEQAASGVIIYECKRVSQWNSGHVEQAFNAKIQRKADFAILVTNAAKKGSGGFFIERGVI